MAVTGGRPGRRTCTGTGRGPRGTAAVKHTPWTPVQGKATWPSTSTSALGSDAPDGASTVTRASVGDVRWRPTAMSEACSAATGPVRSGAAGGCGTRLAGPICADAAHVRVPAVIRMLWRPAASAGAVPTNVPSGARSSVSVRPPMSA